jgi:hypothetical protein
MKDELYQLLGKIQNGELSIDDGVESVRELLFKDLGFATIDNMREGRVGYPEIIYCAGKSTAQVASIVEYMFKRGGNILATRATEEMFEAVTRIIPEAEFNPVAKAIVIRQKEIQITETYIAIVTAGTSDLPVAEEAFITAELFGNRIVKITDIGVAGIHRLFDKIDTIRRAKVIIVIAGMEGALASVIGGLVDKPVIAVPTSVGYGAHFGGLAALLGMLNSCASGVGVVNIDNGFGAGYLASMINKLE